MLVYSPTFLFMLPGLLATFIGLGVVIVLACDSGLSDSWTGVSVASAMLALVGVGLIQLGLYARTYAVIYLGDEGPQLERLWRRFRLEDGLALSGVTLAVGFAITAVSFFDGTKDPRLGVLGLTLMAIGFQGVFASFFLSILGLSEDALVRRRGT